MIGAHMSLILPVSVKNLPILKRISENIIINSGMQFKFVSDIKNESNELNE
jgi:hypothetical protein